MIEAIALLISFFALLFLFFQKSSKQASRKKIVLDPVEEFYRALQQEKERQTTAPPVHKIKEPVKVIEKKKALKKEVDHPLLVEEVRKPPRIKTILSQLESYQDLIIVSEVINKPKGLS